MKDERRPRRPTWTRIARVGITLLSVAGVVAAIRSVSVEQVVRVLQGANPRWVAASLPLLAANFLFRSARFAELLGAPPPPHPAVPRRGFISSVVLNHAANNVLPFRAGDFIRTRDFVARGYSVVSVALTQIVEKAIEGTSLVVCAAPVMGSFVIKGGHYLWPALVLLVMAGPLAAWAVRQVRRIVRERETWKLSLGAAQVSRAFLLSLAADLMDVALIFVCGVSLGLDMPLSRCLAVYGGVNLAIAIPSTPGHLGALEAGASLSLMALGVPQPQALAFALLYRVVQWVPVTAGGAAVVVLRGRGPMSSATRAG
jgi:uncharacterized membrane protein YbhN (UPF0104 family)